MSVPLWLPLVLGLVGQAPAPAGDTSITPAARLTLMKSTMASYDFRSADNPSITYRLQPEPVLRFTNTVGETRDGAIFLWLDPAGRPAASVQLFERRDGLWIEELSSLSTGLIVARSTSGHEWLPTKAGVEFKPVPGAPKPADNAEQRLRQMREITREITADDNFQRKSFQPLRMLPRPLARYGQPGSDTIDGALFAYVLTTDPEVYLLLEARPGNDGPTWHYAFAPSTVYEVRGKVKGVEVWTLPYRITRESRDQRSTFHVYAFQPRESLR